MLVRHAEGLVSFEVADDSALALGLTKRDLVAKHQAHHAAFPQYADWCDDAVLLKLGKSRSYKGGAKLKAGALVLARWDEGWPEAGLEPHWTVWDSQTGWHCAYSASASVVA